LQVRVLLWSQFALLRTSRQSVGELVAILFAAVSGVLPESSLAS